MDSLAPTRPAAAALERPTPTARRLAAASLSPNTRRAYSGALRRLDAWLDGRRLDDQGLAAYLAELHDQGRAPASASTAVAAACFRARLAGEPSPAGERTARVLGGYRRTAGDRGRGQARPFGAADLAAVLATCHQPRRRGRGRESEEVALERGRLDAVIAGLLFMGGMRRSEVSALRWADVDDAADGDGVLVTYARRRGPGSSPWSRLKWAATGEPETAGGGEARRPLGTGGAGVRAHQPGASTTDVMTSRMVVALLGRGMFLLNGTRPTVHGRRGFPPLPDALVRKIPPRGQPLRCGRSSSDPTESA